MFKISINELNRQAWLKRTLTGLPAGLRLLDAGAGELQNRQHCKHLEYLSQDFCQYEGHEKGARLLRAYRTNPGTPVELI